jgi:hypothetical protein
MAAVTGYQMTFETGFLLSDVMFSFSGFARAGLRQDENASQSPGTWGKLKRTYCVGLFAQQKVNMPCVFCLNSNRACSARLPYPYGKRIRSV